MKIVELHEELGILVKGISETIKNEVKERRISGKIIRLFRC